MRRKLVLEVTVKPKSSREEVRELAPDRLEVRVKEPPADGRANQRLIEILAKHYGVPKSSVTIKAGHTSRRKLIVVELPE